MKGMISMPIAPWPVTAQGQSNHPVQSLQWLLRFRGHPVTVDGDFGARTADAVRAFQRQKGLTADGSAGPQTWPALVTEVREGSTGDAVRAAQESLAFRGGEGNPVVDGDFGAKTLSAVRAFQQQVRDFDDRNFPVDGIVGPLTWRALISGMHTD
jgi:peptidoglycan hydrolase-like protein with peptidoglycan-binding domain